MFLTAKEVAERLGVKTKTVLKMINAGTLPAVRMSSKLIRIDSKDFDEFISKNKKIRRRTKMKYKIATALSGISLLTLWIVAGAEQPSLGCGIIVMAALGGLLASLKLSMPEK